MMKPSLKKQVLDVDDLRKGFYLKDGTFFTAVDKLSFKIFEGEFVSIVGPSGCGKSTILKLIAGLINKDGGHLLLDGKEISEPGSDRGMVFQSYTLFPWLTVRENIEFGFHLKKSQKRSKQEMRDISDYWIKLIGLNEFEDFYPRGLSGGMQQRVAIARALANNPEILLLDEPFGALDAQTRSRMQQFTTQLWEETHKTILFVTHDIDEAIFLSDRIIVLTSCPASVGQDIQISIDRPRDVGNVFTLPLFINIKKEILDLITKHTKVSPDIA
jgi:NitT/TauT family transport system ATP-binding protein